MSKVNITIDGKAYPCRPTMGAMLRFKRETGKEITETDGSFSEMCIYLWCCIGSASKHDGLDFNLSMMDFADSISPEQISAFAATIRDTSNSQDTKDSGGEKKNKHK